MKYTISDKMSPLKPSAIREFFKYAGDPEMIFLAAGSPALEALPVETVQRIMGDVLREEPAAALCYSQSEGHPPLREKILSHLQQTSGITKDFDRVLITTGAQQCIDLTSKCVCNEGDSVICEDPSFTGSLNAIRSYNVNLAGVPLERDGIHIEKLEEALKTTPRVRFIYLIPNFQNPSGITMSWEKRKAVYELACRYNVLILEDNPYGDLRFTGEAIPSIKSLDTEGRVLYAGTFSKILSPGIRVGYLVAPEGIFGNLTVAKQCTDVHTSMLAQLLCLRFLEEVDIPAHLQRMRTIYAHKCGVMLDALKTHMPDGVTWTEPEGGLFVWATMPQGTDSIAFCDGLAKTKKVATVAGSTFRAAYGAPSSSFRLNFTTPTDDAMINGIQRMGEYMRQQKIG